MARLLSLNTYHYRRGGSDVAFLEHDRLFASLGWETAVFAMHHPRNEPSPWSRYFANEIELGREYSWREKISMAGKVIYSLEAKQNLSRLLDDWRPDIAHAHCVYHHLSPSVLGLLRQRGIPTVMTAHDLKLACPAYKMLNHTGICERCKYGNLLHVVRHRCIHGSLGISSLIMVESAVHKFFGLYRRNLDRIVVPSRFYGGKLIEWGWPPEKLVYVPNFIEAGEFEPCYSPGDYFVYFGRLAPEKGVDLLIRAAIEAGVAVKIAGTGTSESALRALANASPLIQFVGYCTGEVLWTLVRGSRAVVLPSQWYENAPISVLEAYACGKPVIGARIGGIVEVIRDGETGFLFDPHDADALAAQLRRMRSLQDEDIQQMGKEARAYVASQFTKRNYIRHMLDLYADLGVGETSGYKVAEPRHRSS